jgi:Universal stress protein family
VDKAVSSLSGPVPPFTVRVMPGSPATELTHGAHDADLLVVGSSGRGGIGRLTLGSVTSQVAYEAPCLVVIIPSRCSPLPGPGHGVAAGGGAQLPVDRVGRCPDGVRQQEQPAGDLGERQVGGQQHPGTGDVCDHQVSA